MPRNPEPAAGAAEAAALHWVAERDAVLRGLTHALSNRVGTVGAVAGIVGPDAPVSAPVAAMLHDEAARLEALLALFRGLALDRDAAPEPLHLPDLVPSVVALLAHHPAVREAGSDGEAACAVDGDPEALPLLAPHSALAHALLVLLATAARGTDGVGARLAWRGTAEAVTITVPGAADAVEAARWLLGAAADVRADADGAARVTLPTLGAGRSAR